MGLARRLEMVTGRVALGSGGTSVLRQVGLLNWVKVTENPRSASVPATSI